MEKWNTSLRILEVGWFVGVAIVAGVLGGIWLDNRAGTRPLFVIIGLILGFATAIYGAARMIVPLLKNGSDKGNG
jgi:F0F1-type ATP synthase assembly protein I